MSRRPADGSVPRVVREQGGQATVEFLGVVPALLVAALVAWQLVLVGHAAWTAADAARVAARADLVGADAVSAARSALPGHLERGMQLEHDRGAIRVGVRVPVLHRSWGDGPLLSARSSLEPRP